MDTIITLTLSPCIDKSTSVAAMLPEKKLACAQPVLQPGGGGINVARAIHRLGGSVTAIFPSGGYTGRYLNQLMMQEAFPSLIIETSRETRENIVVFDGSSGNQYRFGMPGTALDTHEWQQCLEALKTLKNVSYLVVSGSLPPGPPDSIYADIAVIARSIGAKLVVDSSGDALQHAADSGVFMIKPNLHELFALAGLSTVDPQQAVSVARSILQQRHCGIIAVSMGAAGAMMVTKSQIFRAKAPQVPVKSTVGAGDSMLAGMVYAISRDMPLQEALAYGVACGTAATLNAGTELCHKTDVARLLTLTKTTQEL
jgi:6-phosphofructokinase 2